MITDKFGNPIVDPMEREREHARRGFCITSAKTTTGKMLYGILWLSDGVHNMGFDSFESAENHAVRISNNDVYIRKA